MELWIRSQDKNILCEVIHLELSTSKLSILGLNKVHYGVVLGTYKTEERALEVLDEIQSILNLKDMYKYDREMVLKSWENVDEKQVKIVRQQMSVYEMPKE